MQTNALLIHSKNNFKEAWITAFNKMSDGEIATVPDIVNAEVLTKKSPSLTRTSPTITTLSATYFGLSPKKKPIIIVAHRIGPLTKLRRIVRTHKCKSYSRNQICPQQFTLLENGHYGDVTIFDHSTTLQESNKNLCKSILGENTYTDDHQKIDIDCTDLFEWNTNNGIFAALITINTQQKPKLKIQLTQTLEIETNLLIKKKLEAIKI